MVNAHLDDIVAALSSTDSKAVCAKIFQCPLQSQKRDIKVDFPLIPLNVPFDILARIFVIHFS